MSDLLKMAVRRRSRPWRYGIAVANAGLALGVRFALDPWLGSHAPYVSFMVAVAATVWLAGFWPALLTAAISVPLAMVFVMQQTGISPAARIIGVSFFALGMVAIAFLGRAMRHAVFTAAQAADEANGRHSELQGEVTRRQGVEEALARAKQDWERTFDAVPDLIAVIDMKHRIVRANRAMAERLGMSAGQCAGLTCFHCVHGLDSPPAECPHAQVMADGREHTSEVYESRLGGYFLITCTPLYEDGKVIGSVHVARDITDRKRAEDELRENRANLLHLAHNVREVFWLGTPEWNKVLYVNPAYEEIWGLSCRSLYESPRSWFDAVVPEDKPAVLAAIGEGVFGQELKVLPEYRIARPDGTIRWIRAWAWPIYDDEGHLHRVAGIAEDVTARRQLEEAEAKYRGLVEESLVGVYLIQGRKFAYVNPRFAEIYGYTQDEIVAGKTVMELVAPQDRDLVAENIRQRIDGSVRSAHYTFKALRKDGQVIDVEVIGSTTIYHGMPAIIGTLIDITQRRRREEQAKQMAAELARSNQDLEQFAYVASHDLQEPLRMVTLHLEIIERRLKDKLDTLTRESMFYAVDGAERMRDLIQDLLNYSRVGRQGKGFVETDMNALFGRVIDDLRAGIEEAGAVIDIQTLPKVKVEATLISQLVQNLLSNAIKYRTPERSPRIDIGARREEKGWVFWIADNGIGIKPEFAEQIFMIFRRLHTRQEYPGTGIGLAICKKIVEYHCGRIWVESRPDEGSTFYFAIPDRP